MPYLTNSTILQLTQVPHLVIVGGSYIALEFGKCSGTSAAA